LRKRMAVTRSEGGRVEVDDGGATLSRGLRKRMVVAWSEAKVEVVACSEARDEPATCFGAGIKDGRWRRHDGA
jgi:hypothetical protein